MRKLVNLEADFKDLVTIKRALEVEISDETRDKRLEELEALLIEINRIIEKDYAVDGFFKLTVDTKQARMLNKIIPKMLYGVHNQLSEVLSSA